MAINKANMAKVRTFNRYFPKGHPKEGQETFFVEKIWKSLDYKLSQSLYFYLESFNYDSELLLNFCNSIKSNSIDGKFHTIRAGKHFKDGDFFSPRVWSGKPYTSPQIQIAPDLEIKRVYDFRIEVEGDYICVFVDNYPFYEENKTMVTQIEALEMLAQNDGLSLQDFKDWFKWGNPFDGQIISWNGDEGY